MLSTPEFAKFAATVVPFLHVTTHIRGRKDDDLLRQKGGSGFPTLLILDADGEVVARPGERSVAAFEEAIEAARVAVQQKATAATTREELAGRWLAQRRLGNFTDPAADRAAYREHRAAMTPEQRAEVEHSIALKEFMSAMNRTALLDRTADDMDSPEFQAVLLELLAAREKLGDWPKGASGNRALIALLAWADHRRDAELFAKWLADLRRVRDGVLAGNAEFLAWFEQRLEALRAGEVEDDFLTAFRNRTAAARRR